MSAKSMSPFKTILCVTLIGSFIFPIGVYSSHLQEKERKVNYYVLSDTTTNDLREMYLLLAPESFTEEKLISLMRELFEKYPKPNHIDVRLRSHVDQLRGFVEGRPFHPLEQYFDVHDPITPRNKYASGIFIRRGGNEIIRYQPAGGELKTIIVKGRDSFESSKN
jgi:hypothetical protein